MDHVQPYGQQLAEIYDAICIGGGPKDCAAEAADLTRLIQSSNRGREPMHVACGVGEPRSTRVTTSIH